ncbi:MAG: ATP-binding cassette domain-containing protein [Bacteroidales bacterium]|nr:MAG: ATP-binding cassette domain-containing protein [Bacteroidales bacterium]
MEFIIKRKVLIGMLFIGITLLGYISYKKLAVEMLPNAELPFLIVQVQSATEVDPNYMEQKAVIPLEGAIGTLENIERIESNISPNHGIIFVSFQKKTNLKYSYLKLQQKIDQVKSQLPQSFFVQLTRFDIKQLTGDFMELQVSGEGGVERIRNLVDKKIKPELENVEGVSRASVFGGREKTIEVIIDPDACKAFGITTSEVRSALSNSEKQKTFVGKVNDGSNRLFVHVSAEYKDVNDIGQIVVGKGPVFLKDVSKIYFGFKKETSFSRINGKDAVTIMLMNDNQANLIDLSHRILKVIDNINSKYKDQDVAVIIQSNKAKDIEDNMNDIINLALSGGLLAIYVLWLFLRNIRIVSLIGLSIPISIYAAFNLFYAFNISINTLSLIGLVLAVGMLVDSSIVVLENIFRHRSNPNMSINNAVIQGTSEVWRSIFASTLTTIVVFVPFLFSDNFFVKIIGNQIGISIISALTISLFVALILIPSVTHTFLSKKNNIPSVNRLDLRNRMIQIYMALLKTTLRRPVQTIITGIILFFVCILLSLTISVIGEEEAVSSQVRVYVNMQAGSSLETSDKTVKLIEEYIKDWPEIKLLTSRIQTDNAVLTLELKEDFDKINGKNIEALKNDIREKTADLPNAIVEFEESGSRSGGGRSGGGGGGGESSAFSSMLGIGDNSESIILKGQDFQQMRKVAEDLKYRLKDKTSWINMSLQSERPEVHLAFNQLLMNELNIPLTEINSAMNNFSGEISTGVRFKQKNEDYDIIIREKEIEQNKPKERNINDLKGLQVRDANGGNHDLQNISRVNYASGISQLNRVNQEKQITITFAYPERSTKTKEALEFYRTEVDLIVAGYAFPSGIVAEVKHEQMDLNEFYFLIGTALLLIFMILASVFESMLTPFALMFTIPLAAIGSMLALILSGNSMFSVNTLTGFLILIGVVVNNGIILIDYTNILRKRGFRKNRAIMIAGISRVRPILITSLTTIIALLPLAIGKKEYAVVIGAPFAITVMGGLTFSTILTLVFIPTCYSGLENGINWIKSQKQWVRITMITSLIVGFVLIYFNVESIVWRMVALTAMFIAIPAITYFLLNSTRRAQTKLIPDDEPIVIKIGNLVKVYEREGRFSREWYSGQRITSRDDKKPSYHDWKDMINYSWQLPLLGFLIYFTYFRLDSGWWTFIFIHFTGLSLLFTLKPFKYLLENAKPKRKWKQKLYPKLPRILLWAFPVVNIAILALRWKGIPYLIIVGLLWFIGLIIFLTAKKLYEQNINVDRIEGRFSGFRRAYYRLIKQIPLLGKRRQPFKALSGVSLEIGTGMFGLLGPNGAGKTTLMRIICGVLDQSYGKIFINGIDTLEKREELQGLIGYLPQEFGTYENMTAWGYLDYQAVLKGLTNAEQRHERLTYVLNAVHMFEKKDHKIGSFSGGMKQRIGIAQILLHLPKILVVDEPTAGLDPRERIRFRNLLVDLSRDRVVIFSTHVIEDISSSCNQVAVINKGKLKFLGQPQQMSTLAEGHVWQFNLPADEFENFSQKQLIVHHRLDGDVIRVRCVSSEKPSPDAVLVKPVLEDAYLCLLKGIVDTKIST